MIAVHWNGAYTIRTCTTFLLDRLATYSDTITAMHHLTNQSWFYFIVKKPKKRWEPYLQELRPQMELNHYAAPNSLRMFYIRKPERKPLLYPAMRD